MKTETIRRRLGIAAPLFPVQMEQFRVNHGEALVGFDRCNRIAVFPGRWPEMDRVAAVALATVVVVAVAVTTTPEVKIDISIEIEIL